MRQTVRQILSLLLAVVMVIGFFPLSAVASEGWGNSNPDQVTDKLLSLGAASDGTDNDDDGPDDEDDADGLPGHTQGGQSGLGPDGQDAQHAPAPGSSDREIDDTPGGPDGPQDSGNYSDNYEVGKPSRLELKFGEDDRYTLRTLNKVVLKSPGLHAREWEEEEEKKYHAGHSDLKLTQDDVLAVSFRDRKDQVFSFDTLVEFTLSCKDWKGRPLSELEALDLSLYLTTQDDELGAAETLFNYTDGEPALFFSTNLLADLLLTKPNAAELERRQKEAEEAEKEQETGEVLGDGHTWSEWTVTAEATCTEDGSRERICSDCDAVEVEAIPAGHTWSEWTVTVEATCTEDGSRERACSECDKTEVEVISAAGHSWDTDDEEAAATCTVCGEEREAVNPYPVELDGDFWRQAGDEDAVESAEYWDALFGGVLYTRNWAEDLLTVAVSQVGYSANTANYIENMEGEVRYYTRYGDWAGLPYSMWDATFVSFCLNYARIPAEAVPRESVSAGWIDALTARELFAAAENYIPKPGDLVFFDNSAAGEEEPSCRVGIVNAVNPAEYFFTAIEGARNHSVEIRTYALSDAAILGYGILPENRELQEKEALAKTMPAQSFEETVGDVTVTVVAEVGAFPANTRMELSIIEDEAILNAAAEAALSSDSVVTADADAEPDAEPDADIEPDLNHAVSVDDTTVDADAVIDIPDDTVDESPAGKAGNESTASSTNGTTRKVARIRAVDICFYDTEDNEIEPAIPVRVTMKSALVNDEKQADIVHVREDGAEKIGKTEKQDDTLTFDAGGFSAYVIVEIETVTTTFTSGDGRTYEVTVTSDSEDGFPEGWKLAVFELTEENETYSEYVDKTAGIIGSPAEEFEYLKLLDISILDETGCETEPTDPVNVTIRLMDKEEGSAEDGREITTIVHFSGEETELLRHEKDGDRLSFQTEGFSVYAIVTEDTIQTLDGKTYGLLNTTDGSSPKGVAMMSNASGDNKLKGLSTTVRVNTVNRTDNVYVANNTTITFWTFEQYSGDQFYVKTTVGGILKYLQISASGIRLVDEIDNDCIITVTAGTGNYNGKYKLSTESGALKLNGTTFERTGKTAADASVWMNFAELSELNDDDFVVYTAAKVSIAANTDSDGSILEAENDVDNGDQVILYTRVWNENTLKYDYYVVDYDGVLVRAYENGDTLSWVGSKVNTMLWDFTEYYYAGTQTPNNYYELQNDYTGKYLAPLGAESGYLSDSTVGINMNGRPNGDYYTTILAWDSSEFAYRTLKVLESPYKLATAPMSKAAVFYFAKMTTETPADLNPVATIDHSGFGIVLKMQDYEKINSNNRSQEQVDVLGNTPYNQWTGSPGLLKKYMSGDYPTVAASGGSLGTLFAKALTVNQQFLLSTYQETGYFEYDSTKNFAHLIWSADDPWIGLQRPGGGNYRVGDFVVYDQLATSTQDSRATLQHGQFFPYNDLAKTVEYEDGQYKITPKWPISSNKNTTDIHANDLSSLDPRKDEEMYGIKYKAGSTAPNYVDHFFGMEMSASFMQSENGLDDWGHDLIFEFSGDDDFWLYVDNVLVLDLGGIHSALDGSINFRTGKVVCNGKNTTLRELYKEAYQEQNPSASDDDVTEWLDGIFKDGGTVFTDYSGHTMRMFYMERGAGASNLHMRFNLAPYVDGEVQLEKEVTGTENITTAFPFQIWYNDKSTGYIDTLADPSVISVKDVQTGEAADYQPSYSPADGLTYQKVFFLNPGQTVSIRLPSETTKYYIKECAIDTGVYDSVLANGSAVTGTDTSVPELKDYEIAETTVANRKKVIYENHVSTNALKTLMVTKRLWQDSEKDKEIHSGTAPGADNTKFQFRIYIGKRGNNYRVYSSGAYYVKNPDGYYCYYQGGEFVPFSGSDYGEGVRDISQLRTDIPPGEERSDLEKATFHTSPGGAADELKAGYSIEIPGLLAGTPYMIEERDNEIPTGYNLLGYTLTDGAYSSQNPGTESNTGIISSDYSYETVSVHNQHGFGLNVKKVWSDAAFMESHDDLYFAVYLSSSDALLENSVRRMRHPATSLNWFFPELIDGKTLNDYLVYEVELTVPEGGSITVDPATGVVSGYSAVTRKEDGDTIDVYAVGNEQGYSSSYTYTVAYSREKLTPEQIEAKVNSRTDTVTNSRPGIRIIKTDLNGNKLSGAVFTLSNVGEEVKTFTSNDDGLVVVAYLLPNKEYRLKEIRAPYGYLSLIDEVTIKVTIDDEGVNTLYVNGEATDPGSGYYSITQVATKPTADNMPTLAVKNRDFNLKAVKIDSYSNQPLSGVTFSLYREVKDYSTGYPMPDYTPMEGYEALVTDENGVIPKIVMKNSANENGLKAGIYYLREQTPSQYKPMPVDIRIVISETGQITLQGATAPGPSGGSWIIDEGISPDIATVELTQDDTMLITVKNEPKEPVRIKKIEQAGISATPLNGVGFALYRSTQIDPNTNLPKPGELPLLAGTTGTVGVEDGILNLGGLEGSNTQYYLYETEPLKGYDRISGPVVITIDEDGSTVTARLNGSKLPCEKVEIKDENGNPVTDSSGKRVFVWEITVMNKAGHVLPSTGGIGTTVFYVAGGFVILGAALLLLRRKRGRDR